uniref:Uncharacterized protein n=1 Tax=Oryza sativa subsp. japonica TaxID=39947 RepID=Q8GVL5_ORYSJ|nr:hypothetical protein [Oryza sativa Japonica Group]
MAKGIHGLQCLPSPQSKTPPTRVKASCFALWSSPIVMAWPDGQVEGPRGMPPASSSLARVSRELRPTNIFVSFDG